MIFGLRTCLLAVTMVCSTGFAAFSFTNYETIFSRWQQPTEKETIIFAGDVFLGRQTEERLAQYGTAFPFVDSRELIEAATYAVVNFESAIAVPHTKTPYYTFQFSTSEEAARSLTQAGFTHFGLANNHAYDYGRTGYLRAWEVLSESGVAFGTPSGLATSSVAVITANEVSVGVIGVYAVVHAPSENEIADLLTTVAATTDQQIIFIHWGEEYELVHSRTQEQLARLFIKYGADLIVGHHPHVVQDIARYDGVPVVYSLGNFVFDQYFSAEVQKGLLLRLTPGEATFELVPVTTLGQPMQPREMTATERQDFFAALSDHSDESLRSEIEQGVLSW